MAMTQMAARPWTPAMQLAVQSLQGASQSYASMDKKKTVYEPESNAFGDILPLVGMGVGAALGGPLGGTALGGAAIGSSIGGMAGSALGGRSAAQIGGMGTSLMGGLNSLSTPTAQTQGQGQAQMPQEQKPSVADELKKKQGIGNYSESALKRSIGNSLSSLSWG